MKVVVVDAGFGNIGSLAHKLHVLGIKCVIAKEPEQVLSADKLLLPGVGFFSAAMQRLKERAFTAVLNEMVLKRGTPLLGICLGVQLFSQRSEEGDVEGFGWVPGRVVRFRFSGDANRLRIPHVGWNNVERISETDLLSGVPHDAKFYFTHSYHLIDLSEEYVFGTTEYGYSFPSVIRKDNVYGTQFHPEKSHSWGMHVIRNFVERC